MSSLVGTWILTESNNWEQFLDTYQVLSGINCLSRRRSSSNQVEPVLKIEKDFDRWSLSMPSSLRSEPSVVFTDGVEFEETFSNHKKIKCLIKTEGDKKLIEFQKDSGTNLVLTTIIREVIGKSLVQTLIAGDKVCTRIFKKKASGEEN